MSTSYLLAAHAKPKVARCANDFFFYKMWKKFVDRSTRDGGCRGPLIESVANQPWEVLASLHVDLYGRRMLDRRRPAAASGCYSCGVAARWRAGVRAAFCSAREHKEGNAR